MTWKAKVLIYFLVVEALLITAALAASEYPEIGRWLGCAIVVVAGLSAVWICRGKD